MKQATHAAHPLIRIDRITKTLPATSPLPAMPALPAVAMDPATPALPAVAIEPATPALPAVAIDPATDPTTGALFTGPA